MIKKQIPNLFTLLNLFFGCIAIVYITMPGIMITVGVDGENLIEIPQQIYRASICLALAAVVDYFDGFLARLLGSSSEMGKQLDSLADLVSFGVAPSLIAYQFLRLSYAQEIDGLSASWDNSCLYLFCHVLQPTGWLGLIFRRLLLLVLQVFLYLPLAFYLPLSLSCIGMNL